MGGAPALARAAALPACLAPAAQRAAPLAARRRRAGRGEEGRDCARERDDARAPRPPPSLFEKNDQPPFLLPPPFADPRVQDWPLTNWKSAAAVTVACESSKREREGRERRKPDRSRQGGSCFFWRARARAAHHHPPPPVRPHLPLPSAPPPSFFLALQTSPASWAASA